LAVVDVDDGDARVANASTPVALAKARSRVASADKSRAGLRSPGEAFGRRRGPVQSDGR